MSSTLCRVLLVEDNPVNITLIKKLLSHADSFILGEALSFLVTSVATVKEAIAALDTTAYNVILLDLMLPDSSGLDTLESIKEKAEQIPIVVQTGSDDENLVVKAFQMGANGYLHKKNIDRNLLIYAIRLAIGRQEYMIQQEKIRQQQQQELEFEGLEHLANVSKTGITARMFGAEPIQESVPDIFAEMVLLYGNLMDLALEQRAYRVEHNISEQLRQMAEKLGFLKASPRDVVEIHTFALREKNTNVTLAKAKAYVEEGRLMVLELMGYLTSYYRKYYIGLSNINLNFRKPNP
jgi:CheY-like chemotaxis protein